MPDYRTAIAAVLHVPVAGSPDERAAQNRGEGPSISLPVAVSEFEHEHNDHNKADECRLTLDWQAVGLDVRLVRNATVEVYVGEPDDFGGWSPSRRDLRFVGVVTEPERSSGEDEPYELNLRALDYTDFFLRAKPFGSSGIPDFSQTIDEAWRRIVSQVPGAGVLAERLLWIGDDPSRKQELRDVLNGKQSSLQSAPFPRIGAAVAERFAKLSKVPTKPNTDGWAVWQQTVGMLGLISYVDRDWVVLTTATNHYTETDPPVFSWGTNVAKLSEGSQPLFRRGVLLTSYDVLRGRTVEARYVPDGVVRKRKTKAHKPGQEAPVDTSTEWDVFTMPGITDPAILAVQARRVSEERSRQELQGTLVTSELRTVTESGETFEIADLHHGDDIKVEFNQSDRDELLALSDTWARINYLLERGYDGNVALILAKNIDSLAFFKPIFHVKGIRTRISVDDDGGLYETAITYTNKINTRGDQIG